MLVAETWDARGNLVQGSCVEGENKIENFLKEMQHFALALANETFTQTASRPHQFAGYELHWYKNGLSGRDARYSGLCRPHRMLKWFMS